jgi:hypothetical protein
MFPPDCARINAFKQIICKALFSIMQQKVELSAILSRLSEIAVYASPRLKHFSKNLASLNPV